MTIDDLRARIDSMDEQLVALLNMRATCAIEIGRIKRRDGLPIYQPEREAEVGRRVRAVNARLGGPLSGDAVGRLFERIIDEARQLEASADEAPADDAGEGTATDGDAGGRSSAAPAAAETAGNEGSAAAAPRARRFSDREV